MCTRDSPSTTQAVTTLIRWSRQNSLYVYVHLTSVMTTRAALQPSLKSVRQKIPPNASSLDLVTKISQHSNFRYFRHHFDSTFPRNPSKPMFRCFQRRRLCDDVFSILADEFGDFRAVFGTALKERNRTIGYKKHGGISACRKAFYLL